MFSGYLGIIRVYPGVREYLVTRTALGRERLYRRTQDLSCRTPRKRRSLVRPSVHPSIRRGSFGMGAQKIIYQIRHAYVYNRPIRSRKRIAGGRAPMDSWLSREATDKSFDDNYPSHTIEVSCSPKNAAVGSHPVGSPASLLPSPSVSSVRAQLGTSPRNVRNCSVARATE